MNSKKQMKIALDSLYKAVNPLLAKKCELESKIDRMQKKIRVLKYALSEKA